MTRSLILSQQDETERLGTEVSNQELERRWAKCWGRVDSNLVFHPTAPPETEAIERAYKRGYDEGLRDGRSIGRPWSEEESRTLMFMREQGYSLRECAKTLLRSYRGVKNQIFRLGHKTT
jgi:hypothetical protein